MLLDRNAEETGAAFVFADRQQNAAERRAQQQPHDAGGQSEAQQHEIVERLVVAQYVDPGEAEIERHALPAGQPVIAAGERHPAEGDEVEYLAEGNGDHREVNAAQAHDQAPMAAAANMPTMIPARMASGVLGTRYLIIMPAP